MPQGEYLQYGGQAIIEGVMMRSPNYFSVACRAPNGQIIQKTEPLEKSWIGRQKWLKFPFIRGSLALIDAMGLGIRAMRFASDVQLDDKYQAEGAEPAKAGTVQSGKKIQDAAIGATMIFSFAFAIFIFVYLPNLVAELAPKAFGPMSGTLLNFIAGMIKLIFFLGYIWGIGRMKEINEVFKYHGAEHKAINTLEADQELDLAHCRAQTRLHPRCGTSFAMIVLIVSIFLMTFVPRYPITGAPGNMFKDTGVRFLIDLGILPFIAGISYELLRLAGKFRNQGFVNVLFKPGLWTQYLTTREPDEKQIEVALVALQAVIDAEAGKLPPAEEPEPEVATVV
jgi:uncharacterized protein YqhQ